MSSHNAWVVTVDMGYGHQRAAYPLRDLSPSGNVVVANNYRGIPRKDAHTWKNIRTLYETVSRTYGLPFVGPTIFGFMDSLQAIPTFYPHRDLSQPSLQLRQTYYSIRKGWGRDLIKYLNTEHLPLISTFFTAAFMAEEHDFKHDIYLVVCDSDISRAWAPFNPKKSRINYLAPTRRVVERLKLYGVREDKIFLTGFPLPQEIVGDMSFETIKKDVSERIINLDPSKRYRKKYAETLKQFLKGIKIDDEHHHPLTLTFAVGGAGAQRHLAEDILRSLKKKLLNEEINLNLVAGSRNDVYLYFKQKIVNFGLGKLLDKNLRLIFAVHKEDYFRAFNEALRTTDVLWTKPSELSFYTALGIPIIIAPPLGSQEKFNRTWLKTIGGGIDQEDPRYTAEWLDDWVQSGWLAAAAMSGFLDGRQFGVQNIVDVVFHGEKMPEMDDELL
jgi:hypothetical protein